MQTYQGRGAVLAMLAVVVTCGPRPLWADDAPNAVFIMRTDGSQVRELARVAPTACHGYPRWSRDGDSLAFEVLLVGSKDRAFYSMNADGTNLREFPGHSMPDWSPDSKQFASQHFLGGAAVPEIFVQNLDGLGAELVGRGRSPRWSPDGGKLAISDLNMVRTLDLVSGEEIALFAVPVEQVFSGFDWSPDGKQLAVVIRRKPNEQRELLIVDTRGDSFGVRVRLKTNAGGAVSWSPDGKQLVFSSNHMIQIVDVQGNGAARKLLGQSGENHSPAWSPDGKSIVFVSDRK
jgi:Tol biopolymer transport system component